MPLHTVFYSEVLENIKIGRKSGLGLYCGRRQASSEIPVMEGAWCLPI